FSALVYSFFCWLRFSFDRRCPLFYFIMLYFPDLTCSPR
uniref:Uncharacterized protein n=1 Tax=Aegilops tauschii subsp. strangulata TaxID=200361 RepID=A0A453I6H2_AEGTS